MLIEDRYLRKNESLAGIGFTLSPARPEYSAEQEYLLACPSMGNGFIMGIIVDINLMSLNGRTFVLHRINRIADTHLAS